MAANLPGLFAQYPEVLGKPNASSEAVKTMKQVVPKVAPRQMKPQTLRLVPAAYQRLIAFFDFVR